jgi:hypothetical protein
MNGLVFEWGFKEGRRKPHRAGFIEIPTLARNLRGWGLADGIGAETDGIAASIRLIDRAPFATGCPSPPCFAEGVFGVWRSYDDVFDMDVPGDEIDYLSGAAEHLFMPRWFDARCEGEPAPKSVVVARERLGLPPIRLVGTSGGSAPGESA